MKRFALYAAMTAMLLLSSCVKDPVYGVKPEPEVPPTPPVEAGKIYINEVNSSTDWIELYNSSDKEVSLAGYVLQDDKGAAEEYKFANDAKIAAKGFFVLEKDVHFTFGISSKGDNLVLYDADGKKVDEAVVPALTDGQTYARKYDGSSEWEVSDTGSKGTSNGSGGNQGGGNQGGDPSALIINEVINNPHDGGTDLIEIYNSGKNSVDLSGFILQDDKGNAEQYVIPDLTVIEPESYMCFTQVQAGTTDGDFNFGLSSKGDVVSLLDNSNKLLDKVEVPAVEKGKSYSRTPNAGDNWKIEIPTPGQSNDNALSSLSAAEVKGVVVINEIYTFSNQSDITDLDFIELYNTSNETVDISGLKMWEGGGNAEAWIIPAGSTIPAKGYFVVECDKYFLHADPVNYPAWGLSKNDELIVLADCGMEIIEQVQAPNMSTDEAWGRKTDGATNGSFSRN